MVVVSLNLALGSKRLIDHALLLSIGIYYSTGVIHARVITELVHHLNVALLGEIEEIWVCLLNWLVTGLPWLLPSHSVLWGMAHIHRIKAITLGVTTACRVDWLTFTLHLIRAVYFQIFNLYLLILVISSVIKIYRVSFMIVSSMIITGSMCAWIHGTTFSLDALNVIILNSNP